MYYCGNNRLDNKVLNGMPIGNRYACLKQGIGKGRQLPGYTSQNYEAIDDVKIYCGTVAIATVPPGYDRLGTNLECFRKGVGIGRKLAPRRSGRSPQKQLSQSRMTPPPRTRNWQTMFINVVVVLILVLVIVVIVMLATNRQ